MAQNIISCKCVALAKKHEIIANYEDGYGFCCSIDYGSLDHSRRIPMVGRPDGLILQSWRNTTLLRAST
jgi:hypothetical protein